jgi:hypothetical protein
MRGKAGRTAPCFTRRRSAHADDDGGSCERNESANGRPGAQGEPIGCRQRRLGGRCAPPRPRAHRRRYLPSRLRLRLCRRLHLRVRDDRPTRREPLARWMTSACSRGQEPGRHPADGTPQTAFPQPTFPRRHPHGWRPVVCGPRLFVGGIRRAQLEFAIVTADRHRATATAPGDPPCSRIGRCRCPGAARRRLSPRRRPRCAPSVPTPSSRVLTTHNAAALSVRSKVPGIQLTVQGGHDFFGLPTPVRRWSGDLNGAARAGGRGRGLPDRCPDPNVGRAR